MAELLDTQFDNLIANESSNWETASLLDIDNYKNGLAMKQFRPAGDDPGLPVLKIRKLDQVHRGSDAERCRTDIGKAVTIHDGVLLFSWSGSLLLDFWTRSRRTTCRSPPMPPLVSLVWAFQLADVEA